MKLQYFLKLRDIQKNILTIIVIFTIIGLSILNVTFLRYYLQFFSGICYNKGADKCKRYLIEKYEKQIQSLENNIECKIPDLPIDNPEVMKHYIYKPVTCGKYAAWIQCVKSFCYVKESIKLKQRNIICDYTEIYLRTDHHVMLSQAMRTDGNYTLNKSDFLEVFCQSSNGGKWAGFVAGVRAIPKPKSKMNVKLYNVLIFGFDSLSRNAFIRTLPKTYEYLTETLKGNILKGYNIVGDGSKQALIPILTGKKDLELPEIRRQVKGSGYADLYPLIWNDYKKFGYVTTFNEDTTKLGTFQNRLNGFKVQPTDHYMRTLLLRSETFEASNETFCIGTDMGHRIMLNYVKNIIVNYENIAPLFTFSFHSALSHLSDGQYNLINNADKDVHQWLVDLKDQKLLENTILILMSDHGSRFSKLRDTVQGKQEERLPFFSYTFPESFKNEHPKAFKNFQQNVNILTTPFDIHETLLDLLRLQNLNISPTFNKHQQKTPPRGISLFQVIPKNRSCSMAYIEPHWCSCLKWHNLNATDKFVTKLAKSVVEAINNYTNHFRNLCESLTLLKVNWAITLTPNEQLIHFQGSIDFDAFLANMSSDMKIEVNMYQVQITVLPGNSVFEATVGHNLSYDDKFIIQMSQISRINKYEGQSNCIYNSNPDLRKYCYCKFLNV